MNPEHLTRTEQLNHPDYGILGDERFSKECYSSEQKITGKSLVLRCRKTTFYVMGLSRVLLGLICICSFFCLQNTISQEEEKKLNDVSVCIPRHDVLCAVRYCLIILERMGLA